MARYYRVVLKNNRTKETQVTLLTFANRKEAEFWGNEFCNTYMYAGKPKFSYEVKAF